jgi:hypothetical protein
MRLVPDEQLAAIFTGEALDDSVPMLPSALYEIGVTPV